MKRIAPRKLQLRKDTLRALGTSHLAAAVGGATAALTCTCQLGTALKACGTTLSNMSDCINCNTDPTKTLNDTKLC